MEDKVQDSDSDLISVQLTAAEISLLQSVLVCMNDRFDWDFEKNNGLIKADVLLEFDESIPRQINNIYNKLF